jgi:tetratricopeptide (TPR) repeat protein
MAKKKNQSPESIEAVESALSKTEQFLENNQKIILYVVVGIAAIVLGFMGYKKYIIEPKQKEAQSIMFAAERYFEMDSLNLALYGDGVNYGFIDIIDEYKRTKAGNLSCYYAGISYLRLGQFNEAIDYLKKFSSKDMIIGAMAKGAIGDAYMELGDMENALDYYEEAADHSTNDFTTPIFLMKAATVCEMNNDFEKALEMYNRIKFEHHNSFESREIEKYISYAETMLAKE